MTDEKQWPMWTLHESTIKNIAERKGLSLEGKDFDNIARLTKKGIDAALDDVWELAIRQAIEYTESEKVECPRCGELVPADEFQEMSGRKICEECVTDIESGDEP